MVTPYYKVADGLYIAGAGAVVAADQLRSEGIVYILRLYDGAPEWPKGFEVCENEIEDGVFIPKPVLDGGVQFVRDTIEAGGQALVVCGLGISRSATFVLAYLVETGYDLKEAFALLRAARPPAWPMKALWTSLITHYNLAYTVDEIETWRTT